MYKTLRCTNWWKTEKLINERILPGKPNFIFMLCYEKNRSIVIFAFSWLEKIILFLNGLKEKVQQNFEICFHLANIQITICVANGSKILVVVSDQSKIVTEILASAKELLLFLFSCDFLTKLLTVCGANLLVSTLIKHWKTEDTNRKQRMNEEICQRNK